MNRTVTFLAGTLLASASLGAQAQDPALQLQVDSGFYVGAGYGGSRTGEGCLGACDVTDHSWNLTVGYQFNRHFAIEGGYADFGESTVSGTLVGVPATVRAETTALELVGVGLLPLTDKFSLYAKLGVFRFDTDSIASGAFTGSFSDKGFGFTAAAGLQYSFWKNFAARVEWQSYSDVGTGVPGFEKDDIVVWRVGARYKF